MTYDLNTPSSARLWPYSPDWRARFQVSRAFLTDVWGSRNNTEQRRALRDAPRLSLAYSTAVTGDRDRAANEFLRAWQNKPAAVPDFSRYVRTAALASAASDELEIASPPAWIAAGQLLALCGSGGFELVVVASVAGDIVTLTEVLASAWPSGSVVRPAIFGLLAGAMRASQPKPGASIFDVALDAYPGGEPPESEGTASDVFNGLEVLTLEPDWSSPPTWEHIWPVEQVDYGIGRTAQFRPIDRAQGLLEAQFTGLDTAATTGLEQIFLRAKGRRGAFYRSTCRPDMLLNADVAASTTFVVQGRDLADDFGAVDFAAVGQAIEIIKRDGTRLRRLVTDIALSGANTAITVSSAVTLTTATTARISWMPKVRFASDTLTTEWLTPSFAQIRTTFQTVDD